MPRPLIAVTTGRYPDERFSAHRGYVDALLSVGAAPVLVPCGRGPSGPGHGSEHGVALPDSWSRSVLEHCAGVLFTGGGDVAPTTTGVPPHPTTMEVDEDRDAVELDALAWALESGLPVLAICRGIQLLAVAAGGSLVPDLPEAGCPGHWQEDRQYEPVHEIEAKPGTTAARALNGEAVVNSIHHQAVADPGAGLEATAWAPDGVIEAIEGDRILGVQWHPERMTSTRPVHLAPFEWLVHG